MYVKDLHQIFKLEDFFKFEGKDFYGLTVFVRTQEWCPLYNPGDVATTETVTRINQYATVCKEVLQKAILQLHQEKAQFVVFKTKIADVKIQTIVEV